MMKNTLKRALTASLAALMLAGCGSKSDNGSSADDLNPTFTINEEEEGLGEYTVSSKGTKLYYEVEDVPPALMLALEKYFISFSQSDYDSYAETQYPEYITEMNKFLEEDFGYDLKESFAKQCENLEANAGGKFRVSRIRAELNTDESGTDNFFEQFGELFSDDFYDKVKADTDKLYSLIFFVMSENENGEELMLVSEYEIVFGEKDGKFFTFG